MAHAKNYFQLGLKQALPFIFIVGPFGLVFGTIASNAGLSVIEALSFSVFVMAGSAQLTALQLMLDGSPTLIVVLSALAVNLRMMMYSASLTPYLGKAPLKQRILAAYSTLDQSYALSLQQFETEPQMTLQARMRFFLGAAAPVIPTWYISTFAGAFLGKSFPSELPLDFAIPLTFIALFAPLLRSAAHISAALSATIAAALFSDVPFNLGLIMAGFVGMSMGAATERHLLARADQP